MSWLSSLTRVRLGVWWLSMWGWAKTRSVHLRIWARHPIAKICPRWPASDYDVRKVGLYIYDDVLVHIWGFSERNLNDYVIGFQQLMELHIPRRNYLSFKRLNKAVLTEYYRMSSYEPRHPCTINVEAQFSQNDDAIWYF